MRTCRLKEGRNSPRDLREDVRGSRQGSKDLLRNVPEAHRRSVSWRCFLVNEIVRLLTLGSHNRTPASSGSRPIGAERSLQPP